MFDEKVQIYSDPDHRSRPPSSRCFRHPPGPADGQARLGEKGALKDLTYTRFWAQKMDKAPSPLPSNFIMEGGTATMADLIS